MEKSTKDFKYDIRFRYFEYKEGSACYHRRITRGWWKPFYFIGDELKKFIYHCNYKYGTPEFDRLVWFIRKHLTYS